MKQFRTDNVTKRFDKGYGSDFCLNEVLKKILNGTVPEKEELDMFIDLQDDLPEYFIYVKNPSDSDIPDKSLLYFIIDGHGFVLKYADWFGDGCYEWDSAIVLSRCRLSKRMVCAYVFDDAYAGMADD